MIKIDNLNIRYISAHYFSIIKDECLEKASFYVEVFNVLFNGAAHNLLRNHPLNGNSKKSLLNLLLLPGHQLQNQTSYHIVIQGHCKPWVTGTRLKLEQLCAYLNNENNLREILLCDAENCFALDQHLMNHFGLTIAGSQNQIDFIGKILDYDAFDKYAYRVGKLIDVNTCPYCNRGYIHTVYDREKNEIIRPEFDHFYPQKLHPFLGLSFYNLIPSCYYCNMSLKKATVIHPDTHLNPYLEGFDKDVFFRVKIDYIKSRKSDPENYKIDLISRAGISLAKFRRTIGNNNNEGNINLFKLNKIYPTHLDIVGELVVKCEKYSSWYSGPLLKLFGHLLSTNKTDFYRYYFGNYYNEKDFHRRPLAKMTKDIVRQVLPEFIKE